MQNAAITGFPGTGKASRNAGVPTDEDFVKPRFIRHGLNQLCVSDITEHQLKTREGKIYCCAVLDMSSRKIVGWSINSVQDSQLVVNALDMAIKQRKPLEWRIPAEVFEEQIRSLLKAGVATTD